MLKNDVANPVDVQQLILPQAGHHHDTHKHPALSQLFDDAEALADAWCSGFENARGLFVEGDKADLDLDLMLHFREEVCPIEYFWGFGDDMEHPVAPVPLEPFESLVGFPQIDGFRVPHFGRNAPLDAFHVLGHVTVGVEELFSAFCEIGGHVHFSAVRQCAVHLEEGLAEEAVHALEETPAAAVSRERKVERVDLGLRPVGAARQVACQ